MKKFAVVFVNSFDSETPIYLFSSEKEALTFLKETFNNELESDKNNGWSSEGYFEKDGYYAKIITHYPSQDGILELRIGQIYN